jgi:hypothetical protein
MKLKIAVMLIMACAYSAQSHAACTYKKDAWGNTIITNGSTTTKCRTNAWGNVVCN